MTTSTFDWSCKHTWKRSAKNTMWCVIGCAIGDFGTILFFQLSQIPFPIMGIMTLAIINGLISSIILETFILIRQNFTFKCSFKNCFRDEFNFNVKYGNNDEFNRLSTYWRSNFNMVGHTYYVDCRFFNSMAI